MQIDQDLYAALYVLGFNFLDGDLVSGEIAEIKGDMTIKLVHRPGEELKFVVELPGDKQMTFSVRPTNRRLGRAVETAQLTCRGLRRTRLIQSSKASSYSGMNE